MDKDTLIAKQALEIENLKGRLASFEECCRQINMHCICIGGPLNDNVLGYTPKQLKTFWAINQLAAANL